MPKFRIGCYQGAVLVAALAALVVAPITVYAECSFVPPWPPITPAVSSARDIVVGDIVDDINPADLESGDGDTEALRVTAVLRGTYDVGDLIGTDYLLPNWPWGQGSEDTEAIPSCSYLQALPGERIALAFDALMPGQELHDPNNVTWYQPPTRYNAMGVLVALEPSEGWGDDRERVTLAELRNLAELPQTDVVSQSPPPTDADPWPFAVLAGVLAALVLLARPPRDIKRR